MSYDIHGWVDVKVKKGGVICWETDFSLSEYLLGGDMVANLIFGLAKSPVDVPHFSSRGLPVNATNEQKRSQKAHFSQFSNEYIKYTYAYWNELKEALAKEFEEEELESSSWGGVFKRVSNLSPKYLDSEIRIVLEATW